MKIIDPENKEQKKIKKKTWYPKIIKVVIKKMSTLGFLFEKEKQSKPEANQFIRAVSGPTGYAYTERIYSNEDSKRTNNNNEGKSYVK